MRNVFGGCEYSSIFVRISFSHSATVSRANVLSSVCFSISIRFNSFGSFVTYCCNIHIFCLFCPPLHAANWFFFSLFVSHSIQIFGGFLFLFFYISKIRLPIFGFAQMTDPLIYLMHFFDCVVNSSLHTQSFSTHYYYYSYSMYIAVEYSL